MTDLGRATVPSRLYVGVLALIALGAGAFWMWSTATGGRYAGVPSWVIGLVVVGLMVALASAVHRFRHDDR